MELPSPTVGWLLRRVRLGMGLSMGQLAQLSGLSVVQVSAVERGVAEDATPEVNILLMALQMEQDARSIRISPEPFTQRGA